MPSKNLESALAHYEKDLRQLRFRFHKRKINRLLFLMEETEIIRRIGEIKEKMLNKKFDS